MLDSFWNSLELDDIADLNYTTTVEYNNSNQKEEVLEKIDWVILKLHKIKDVRKYDYDVVTALFLPPLQSLILAVCLYQVGGVLLPFPFCRTCLAQLHGDPDIRHSMKDK